MAERFEPWLIKPESPEKPLKKESRIVSEAVMWQDVDEVLDDAIKDPAEQEILKSELKAMLESSETFEDFDVTFNARYKMMPQGLGDIKLRRRRLAMMQLNNRLPVIFGHHFAARFRLKDYDLYLRRHHGEGKIEDLDSAEKTPEQLT